MRTASVRAFAGSRGVSSEIRDSASRNKDKDRVMNVLLTGGKGMLGRTLCAELTEYHMIPTDLPDADITNITPSRLA